AAPSSTSGSTASRSPTCITPTGRSTATTTSASGSKSTPARRSTSGTTTSPSVPSASAATDTDDWSQVARGRRRSSRRLPGCGVSLSGTAPEMARRRAIVARIRSGNLAADGEERPHTSPKGKPHTPRAGSNSSVERAICVTNRERAGLGLVERHAHGLDVDELAQADGAQLPAVAGVLDAAERVARVRRDLCVDEDHPGLELAGEARGLVAVAGPDAGPEAEPAVVGDPDRVGGVGRSDEGRDRAEQLLVVRRRRARH